MASDYPAFIGPRLADFLRDPSIPDHESFSVNISLKSAPSGVLQRSISSRQSSKTKMRRLIKRVLRSQTPMVDYYINQGITKDDISQLWINNSIRIFTNRAILLQSVLTLRTTTSISNMIQGIELTQDLKLPILDKLQNSEITTDSWHESLVGHYMNAAEIMPNLVDIGAEAMWKKGYMGENVVIAVIDDCFDYRHPDLEDRLWDAPHGYARMNGKRIECPNHGFNFGKVMTDDPDGLYRHGTFVAGILVGDGSLGKATGVAPKSELMLLSLANPNSNGTDWNCWQAMQFAAENGAKVISMSLHSLENRPDFFSWRRTTDTLHKLFVVHVNSAGNNGNDPPFQPRPPNNVNCPANCPPPVRRSLQRQRRISHTSGVVAVGASLNTQTPGMDDIRVDSSKGPCEWPDYPELSLLKPELCAPGNRITSLINRGHTSANAYGQLSQTSVAQPHVAGALALLIDRAKKARRWKEWMIHDLVLHLLDHCAPMINQLIIQSLIPPIPDGFGSGRLKL